MNNDESQIELLLRYLGNDLDPEKHLEVEEVLKRDRQARALLRELSEHAAVAADIQRVVGEKPASNSETEFNTSRQTASYFAASLLVVATLVLLGLSISWLVTGQEDRNEQVVTIVALNGPVEWTGDGGLVRDRLHVGNRLNGGTIELNAPDAWIEMGFEDGSKITLTGQSTLTVSDEGQKLLRLRNGSLSADVNDQPESTPMVIRTHLAELTVLGTQFNMKVDGLSTVVSVNEGVLRVKRLADNKQVDVNATQQIVVAASRQPEFNATIRPQSVTQWASQLPGGIIYGNWSMEYSALVASPLLWRDCKKPKQDPILLFLAATSVSRGENPPVELTAGSQLHIRGSIEKPMDLIVGLTSQHLGGGFAGKHLAVRKKESFIEGGGEFEFFIPVEEFFPQEPEYPKTALGLGLYDWWCLTINEDAGLKIRSVELRTTSDNKLAP